MTECFFKYAPKCLCMIDEENGREKQTLGYPINKQQIIKFIKMIKEFITTNKYHN